MGAHDDEAGSSRSKRSRHYETVEEAMLPGVHHPFLLWEGCNQAAKSRYNTRLAQLLPKLIYSSCVVDWNLFVAGTNEEIFASEAWSNAFNIDEPIYSELCHEFYSTYEFDEVCVADELRTKKIIKFKLYGRAFCWTLLEFAKSDEDFNAEEYWLSISREENLSLSRSHASTIRNLVLRMKRKGASSQKESMIYCGQFITKISKRKNLLFEEVLNSLSTLIYCRALDITTLRELINSEGRLIPEAPEPGQFYHWDMFAEVFEHMARVYSVPLQGAYNPPGYDQQQYDQYYQ
ncbi:hypothetical protein Tco_0910041 [Tanacetum coccineum]|uniref:Uncharacterized protein n=1 Tax=Tanacetum coccineum TaxID=301880 RepID=A0ABQ5CRR6_9ASTR